MALEPYHPAAAPPAANPEATEVSPVEARQGIISGRVILVLLVSLFLSVLALGIGYFIVR